MAKPASRVRGVYEYMKPAPTDWIGFPLDWKPVIPTGVWYIRYRDKQGALHRERVGPKGKALEAYRKRRAEIVEGKFFPEKVRTKRVITFKEIAEDFLKWSRANKKSWDDDVQRMGIWIEDFGARPAEAVTPQDIETVKVMLTTEKKLSPPTVNRYLASLRTAFYRAMKDEKLEKNPVRRVQFYREDDSQRVRYLSDEEEKRLFAAMPQGDAPIVTVALHTGIRCGGIQALLCGDVDFGAGLIDVREAKGGRSYQVPMNRIVREALLKLRDERVSKIQANEKGNVTALPSSILQKHPVFPRWHGFPSWKVSMWFGKVTEAAGIPDFTFHCLRHTFASRLVMAGVDLTTVKELMGHRSIVMTLRYAHLSPAHKQSAVERLAGGPKGDTVEPSITRSINGGETADFQASKSLK